MDTTLIKSLSEVLDDEYKVCSDILTLGKKKREVLVKGKVKELENILKVEQMLVIKMGKLERERETVITNISKELNENPDEITVTKILEKINITDGTKLKNSQEILSNTLKEIKDLNHLNSKLIKNSLEFIDYSINLISNASTSGDNNYGNSGKVNDPNKKNFFDMKL